MMLDYLLFPKFGDKDGDRSLVRPQFLNMGVVDPALRRGVWGGLSWGGLDSLPDPLGRRGSRGWCSRGLVNV